jgi:hypothetical protein
MEMTHQIAEMLAGHLHIEGVLLLVFEFEPKMPMNAMHLYSPGGLAATYSNRLVASVSSRFVTTETFWYRFPPDLESRMVLHILDALPYKVGTYIEVWMID